MGKSLNFLEMFLMKLFVKKHGTSLEKMGFIQIRKNV